MTYNKVGGGSDGNAVVVEFISVVAPRVTLWYGVFPNEVAVTYAALLSFCFTQTQRACVDLEQQFYI